MTTPQPDRFLGRRALVTGAASGIGRAIADRLAADGAYVIVADRDLAAADTAVAELRAAGGHADAAKVDVADGASVAALAASLGSADLVVANAGVQSFAPLLELSGEEWDRIMGVNARGMLSTLQLAAQLVPDGGAIVSMASIQGVLANPLSAHYAASKAAVLSLTKTFARELAPRAVRVNAVAPGRIDTPLAAYANVELGRLTDSDPAEMTRARAAANPLGRSGTPAEVAAAVAFLLSDDASYITGECLNVCGGDVML